MAGIQRYSIEMEDKLSLFLRVTLRSHRSKYRHAWTGSDNREQEATCTERDSQQPAGRLFAFGRHIFLSTFILFDLSLRGTIFVVFYVERELL